MFLKRLDVSGFKSFANKTSVAFVPGVTAVVGPNGSGKSNITEAIRWVLGEQSAKSLRGAKMEDIIFSGSDSRKAVNMAEVTLTLDNQDHYLPTDYSEISVTRRVYRSGESEFLLNRQSCRLKDIVDLFMDSGLGREAYSVIGQGKIDEILNSKAEEKRKIFEEAAGVLKYKLRKQTAEKKLDDSADDLNRVEDILHELESRIEPLARQSSIAKDYLSKKDELEEADIALLAHDIAGMHEEWEKSKKRSAELETEKNKRSERLKSSEQVYQEKRNLLEQLDRSIESDQAKLAESGEYLEKIIGRKEVLAERKKHAQTTSFEMNDRLTILKKQLASERLELNQTDEDYRRAKAQLDALNKQLAGKRHDADQLDEHLDGRIEQLKGDYIETLNQQASMKNEQRYLNDRLSGLDQKRNQTGTRTGSARKTAEDARKKKQELEEQLGQKAGEGRDMQQKYSAQAAALEADRERYDRQKEAVGKIGRLIEQATSRKDMLESLKEDYAGFYQGVRTVLKNKARLRGILGAVAELIRVDEPYRTAIEVALGGASQNIIVTDENAGRQAIRFLRERQAGRATFLPVSVMKARSIAQADRVRAQAHSSFIGPADELVACDSRFHAVIAHLLGHVMIAENLQGANELARLAGYKYRIVTLKGDVIAPGGAMTGGSLKKNGAGLIGRESEIEQIAGQIKEMKKKQGELREAFSSLKQHIAAEELEAEKQRQSVQSAAEAYRDLEDALREAAAVEKNATDRYQLLARENHDFDAESRKITQRLGELAENLAAAVKDGDRLTEEINRLTAAREDRDSAKSALQEEMTALKVHFASQNEKVLHLKETREQMHRRVDDLAASAEALQNSIVQMASDLDQQSLSSEKIAADIHRAKETKERLMKTLAQKKKERETAQGALSKREQAIHEERLAAAGLSEALQQENVRLGRFDVQLDHLIDTLRQDYQMTFEAARADYPLKMDPEAARKKVRLIKRAIEELGTVNVGAIEEYENVLERQQFLSSQRDDLLKARQTLENVMTEMDQEVEQRFSATFKKIRGHFQIIFRELFGGGQADLRLIDPHDLLGSGVDIFAEPPGKKLQRLSLLSGGERALTAIALLFSILKVRPVPFCVLDEVEAALDDANVDRYARFLKKFSTETQFIVVTHRHGTMEHADVLYGVTMQESGISKLVSVRLEETEELLSAENG
ncbi:chromosome segregation protein SMC [Sporolactobacillus vineae]|uniref:chromosome segregation protein SMC n=1 Tax=Sporolactobacillus vineae TaxID=444463 RepID=UPI000289CCF9|nr:chromosome segregation protein SMC [Sporolactobacillus vineae]